MDRRAAERGTVEAAGDLAGFGNVRVNALIRSSLVPSQIFALTRFE